MMRTLACLALVVVVAGACGGAVDVDAAVLVVDRAIVGGGADNGAHPAVVRVANDDGDCSGAIVDVDVDTGTAVVVTAAHCVVGDVVVFLGPGDVGTAAGDVLVHPEWRDINDFDVDLALVRVGGATGATPTLAVAAADALAVDDIVTVVGVGATAPAADDGGTRRRVDTAVTSVDARQFTTGAAPCGGDSGGPVLDGSGAIVGVAVAGDGDCAVFGLHVRTSAFFADFVAPFLGAPPPTCNGCIDVEAGVDGACADALQTCNESVACGGYNACLAACADDACADACRDSEPAGAAVYDLFVDCLCVACVDTCATEAFCSAEGEGEGEGEGEEGEGEEGEGEEGEGEEGEGEEGEGEDGDEDAAGCACAGGSVPPLALGLLALLRRRRC